MQSLAGKVASSVRGLPRTTFNYAACSSGIALSGLYASGHSARLAEWRSLWTVASPTAIRRGCSQVSRFGRPSADALARKARALAP